VVGKGVEGTVAYPSGVLLALGVVGDVAYALDGLVKLGAVVPMVETVAKGLDALLGR
jgi:uncharacterized membrane protein